MFQSIVDLLNEGQVQKCALEEDGRRLTYTDVVQRWQADDSFRSFFIKLLADAPFAAYRWETPPVTKATAENPFEFVLLDYPRLERTADPTAFESHFESASEGQEVVAFDNLKSDAYLVVPCPRGPEGAYAHLGACARTAPASQNHALWQTVGTAMQERICSEPLWLSTAGMGVAWLHVRLDQRPKYYAYRPYRDAL
jgi:hypothetical protein